MFTKITVTYTHVYNVHVHICTTARVGDEGVRERFSSSACGESRYRCNVQVLHAQENDVESTATPAKSMTADIS